jgi:hypothetical protein
MFKNTFKNYAENVIKPMLITPRKDLERLFAILRTQRPAHSVAENNFVADYLAHLTGAWQDKVGNVIVPVNMENSKTMFSCHTDTVHPKPNLNYENRLVVDNTKQHVFTDGKQQLGADDGVGVWFMLNMIERGIPGLYIFHRAEEIGGVGSEYFAKYHEQYILNLGIQRCVAFDRHYCGDVITHQGTKCASDEFAQALADALNQTKGFIYEPSDAGVFTDSANYTHLIPECTNISVGYWSQHSVKETLDYGFAVELLERVLLTNWEALPTERDVDDHGYVDYPDNSLYYDYFPSNYRTSQSSDNLNDDMYALVIDNPEAACALLEQYGITRADLLEEINYLNDINQPPIEVDRYLQ